MEIDLNASQPAPLRDLLLILQVECDSDLLNLALIHRSYAYENGGLPTNERLEFLGDSVLGVIVTDVLYRDYPDLPEGNLARMRASVVNAQALGDIARSLGLGAFIQLGKGEITSGGRDKTSILADCLEAVIGAVFLSEGIETATQFVNRLFLPLIKQASQRGAGLDWKTSLQELTGELGLDLPTYRVTDTGPDHAKSFHAEVLVDSIVCGEGSGTSKKVAEQMAAENAHRVLMENSSRAGTP